MTRNDWKTMAFNLQSEVTRLRAALDRVASWGEGEKVTASFDEPHSAEIARRALRGEGK